jgi:hypothetical protein
MQIRYVLEIGTAANPTHLLHVANVFCNAILQWTVEVSLTAQVITGSWAGLSIVCFAF